MGSGSGDPLILASLRTIVNTLDRLIGQILTIEYSFGPYRFVRRASIMLSIHRPAVWKERRARARNCKSWKDSGERYERLRIFPTDKRIWCGESRGVITSIRTRLFSPPGDRRRATRRTRRRSWSTRCHFNYSLAARCPYRRLFRHC
jgi:hypothetical protein